MRGSKKVLSALARLGNFSYIAHVLLPVWRGYAESVEGPPYGKELIKAVYLLSRRKYGFFVCWNFIGFKR